MSSKYRDYQTISDNTILIIAKVWLDQYLQEAIACLCSLVLLSIWQTGRIFSGRLWVCIV